jgi:hypothetical protein
VNNGSKSEKGFLHPIYNAIIEIVFVWIIGGGTVSISKLNWLLRGSNRCVNVTNLTGRFGDNNVLDYTC